MDAEKAWSRTKHGKTRIFFWFLRSLYTGVESVTMRSTEHEARSRMEKKTARHGRARKETDFISVLLIVLYAGVESLTMGID